MYKPPSHLFILSRWSFRPGVDGAKIERKTELCKFWGENLQEEGVPQTEAPLEYGYMK